MAINLNTSPYYDDFNEDKNYYQILFKPSLPVQARELTQLQTILNRQIEKFGSHVFSHGSLVIPGNSYLDQAAKFVIVQQYDANDLNNFAVNDVLKGLTTGVKGVIRYITQVGSNKKIYISYTSGGTNGENVFANGEILQKENTSLTCQAIATNATGIGSLFVMQEGIFYVNGFFVKCQSEILEVDGTTNTPTASIVFEIKEKIVDSSEDQSLLDPAQGSYNFAAPGADRLKISLSLQKKPFDFTIDKNYILLMKVEKGRIRYHSDAPKYSELEKSLAKRTYDESGNYIVDGLQLNVIEDLRTLTTHGRSTTGDANKLCYQISAGRAYIQGFECKNLSQTELIVDKARTASHIDYIKNVNLRPEFGNYFYVTGLKNLPNFSSHEKVEFYNTAVSGGIKIGEAYVYDIDYIRDDIGSGKAIYKMYFRDRLMISGGIKTINVTNAGTGYSTAPTVTVSAPPSGGVQATAEAYVEGGAIKYIAVTNPGSGYLTAPTITISGGGGSNGAATASLINYDILDAGRITYSGGSATVLHRVTYQRDSGTSFTEGETVKGSVISYSNGGNYFGEVAIVHSQYQAEGEIYLKKTNLATQFIPSIGSRLTGLTSQTSGKILTLQSNGKTGRNSLLFKLPVTFAKTIRDETGSPNISYTVRKMGVINTNSSGNGSLTVTGGIVESLEQSSFVAIGASGAINPALFSLNAGGTTITLTGGPASSSIEIYYELKKTNSIERTKTLTDRTQTGLSVVNNVVQLDRADIYQIVSITSSTLGDVTDRFKLDNGQRDTHYQNGRLLATDLANYGTLTVVYKFFQHSISGDYFTVDSYQTLGADYYNKVGRYRSENDSIEYFLKDYFDFRKIITDSADLVANGKLMSFDVQNYLPRIDTVVLNKDGEIIVKNGLPSNTPKAPEVNDTEVGIAQIYLGPYTRSMTDVVSREIAVRRYTMGDIKNLETRVQNLEEYSLLNFLERSVIEEEVVDAETGLNRYKSGYLVDNFDDFRNIADIGNKSFKVLYENKKIKPQQMPHEFTLQVNSTTNAQVTGNSITLPYSVKALVNQNISSRVVNLNPYLQTRWIGELTINPSFDSWVEVEDLPTIINNVTETVTVTRYERVFGGTIITKVPTYVFEPQPVNPPVIVPPAVPAPPPPPPPPPQRVPAPPPPPPRRRRRGRKIICTKLYELGFLPEDIYKVDQEFGKLLEQKDPDTLYGYHYWANMVVEWMSGSGIKILPMSDDKFYPLIQKWSTSWARKIATPWAEHMAYEMGLLKEDNKLGKLLMKIGKPLSKGFANKYKKNNKPGLMTAYFSIIVFSILYILVNIYPKGNNK